MRIGLYGGMANNMYVFAHSMAKHGADVCFIRDRSDRYPFSQPVWEDVAFPMKYEEVRQASWWPWSKWEEIERELQWVAPEWLYDPFSDARDDVPPRPAPRRAGALAKAFLRRYSAEGHRAQVLKTMQSCGALLVCGVEATVLARASGKPYVILPHGGDLMIAAGLLRPPVRRARTWLKHVLLARQLAAAYADSLCVGVHEPSAFGENFYGAERFFRRQKVYFLAIPIPIRPRRRRAERREALAKIFTRLGASVPEADYIGFVPSRVDYEWKGQDRLLHALATLKERDRGGNIHVVFSGWGEDFGRARDYVEEARIADRVTFLSHALSKPLLYSVFQSVDFVVDQFVVGMTGTSSLEAMACGAPLMMWIDPSAKREWGPPPVLQARTAEEIVTVLTRMSEHGIALDEVGSAGQQWVRRLHDPATVVRGLLAKFSERNP